MLAAVDMALAGFRVIATMRDPNRSDRLVQLAETANVRQQIDIRALDITKHDQLPAIVADVERMVQGNR